MAKTFLISLSLCVCGGRRKEEEGGRAENLQGSGEEIEGAAKT